MPHQHSPASFCLHSLPLLCLLVLAACGADPDSASSGTAPDEADVVQGGDSDVADDAADLDLTVPDTDGSSGDAGDAGQNDVQNPMPDATDDDGSSDAEAPDPDVVLGEVGDADTLPEADAPEGDDVTLPPIPESWDVCNDVIGTAVAECVEELLLDPALGFSRGGRQEALALCADAEPVAIAWDRWCASPSADAFGCGIGFDAWYMAQFPPCLQELRDWNYDRTCVFGPQWRTQELEPSIREISRAWYDTIFAYRAIDARQLVRAVQLSGSPEVTTLEDALASIDGGEARRILLWDTSSRLSWVLWEFGRGDNSYGAWFGAGQTEAVARVVDGDTYECVAYQGPEMRACGSDDQCADGLRCVGVTDFGEGRCVNLTLDPPDLASPCALDSAFACGEDSALLCSGATNDFDGQCRPAWMRGAFGVVPETEGDDTDPQGLRSQVLVGGLATVSTDVGVRIVLQHPDMTQVSLTLENPAGTVVAIAIPPGAESYLVIDQAVAGFPGDESANGPWTLTVYDAVPDGQRPYLQEWTLRLGSRWD